MESRRDMLKGIGTVGTVAVAGCSGGSEDNNDSSNEEGDTSPSPETPSENNASPTPETSIGNNSTSTPETVVKQFWEALINEDYEAANNQLHPGSFGYPLDESDISIPDFEVSNVKTVSFDVASERAVSRSKEDYDATVKGRTGTADYTLVLVEFSKGNIVTPVVEDDGKLQAVYLQAV
ncbi:hypothetical protein [Haloarcula laminariae]|uniref:hypothetical protein n=1 Tax=Haloarcula laminariae TaxID=2961577 RepID=UPI002405B9E5|nr:hypothetical protein [Halomicroarcula sp. FL173]